MQRPDKCDFLEEATMQTCVSDIDAMRINRARIAFGIIVTLVCCVTLLSCAGDTIVETVNTTQDKIPNINFWWEIQSWPANIQGGLVIRVYGVAINRDSSRHEDVRPYMKLYSSNAALYSDQMHNGKISYGYFGHFITGYWGDYVVPDTIRGLPRNIERDFAVLDTVAQRDFPNGIWYAAGLTATTGTFFKQSMGKIQREPARWSN